MTVTPVCFHSCDNSHLLCSVVAIGDTDPLSIFIHHTTGDKTSEDNDSNSSVFCVALYALYAYVCIDTVGLFIYLPNFGM